MNVTPEDLQKLIKAVPFFHHFSLEYIKKVLAVGKVVEVQQGRVLCRDGDESDRLFILLVGQLVVRAGEVILNHIDAVDIVGEMGMVTGMPRLATVEAATQVRLITIKKADFDLLLQQNAALAANVYKNILDSVCHRMRENNVHLVKLQLQSEYEALGSLV
jgi:voltage-gated potassium channel